MTRRTGQASPTRRSSDLSNMAKAIRQFGEAAPINQPQVEAILGPVPMCQEAMVSGAPVKLAPEANQVGLQDRKSTRLNSSHGYIADAVLCMQKITIVSSL